MSNIMSAIFTYREVLNGIGKDKPIKTISESEVHNDISEVISAVNNAENSLKEVISIKESYKEILKMVF